MQEFSLFQQYLNYLTMGTMYFTLIQIQCIQMHLLNNYIKLFEISDKLGDQLGH